MSVTETVGLTAEQARHYGTRVEKRKTDQKTAQPADRIMSWFEMMSRARGGQSPILTGEQAMAGRDLSLYWWTVYGSSGVTASYGDQRWNGTPVSQIDHTRLLGPEWRETCRQRLEAARKAVGDPRLWDAVLAVVETDGRATDAGYAIGYKNELTASAAGVMAIKGALQLLAVHWGYTHRFEREKPPIRG